MTAIRNFPNAPRRSAAAAPLRWRMPALAIQVWRALERFGQRRAAWELDALAGRWALSNPALARQFRAAAAQCRRAGSSTQARNHVKRSIS
ncbi:MAG: hypothetical protein ACRC2B_19650 [Rubrivivax sp.]